MAFSWARRAYRRTISAVLLFGGSGVAASGSPEVLPVDIVYHALGTDCPSREQFVAAVQEALGASGVQLSRDEREFTVTLENGRGTLEVRSHGEASTSHDVRGSSCSEVGDALAFSLALAIAPGGPAASTRADESSPAVAVQASTFASEPRPSKAALGLGIIGESGPTPLALGGTLFGDLPHANGRLLAPHLRLGVAYLETVTPHTFSLTSYPPAVAASFTTVRVHWQWYLVRAELCGLHITASTSAYGLRICTAMDAGLVASKPSVLESTNASRNPWFAAGFGARAFWTAFGAVFELGTGLSFPFTRYRYFLEDYEGGSARSSTKDVYQVQPVGWRFSAGAAYGFP